MAYQFKLQVPISKKLNDMAKAKALEMGFGSLNDMVRLLITNFATGKFELALTPVNPHTENLEELEKIVAQARAEYKRGEAITIDPSKPITPQLIDGLD